jgi:hypothetical protein
VCVRRLGVPSAGASAGRLAIDLSLPAGELPGASSGRDSAVSVGAARSVAPGPALPGFAHRDAHSNCPSPTSVLGHLVNLCVGL